MKLKNKLILIFFLIQFDPHEYIFLGKVIDYVGPIESDILQGIIISDRKRSSGSYCGLLVKLEEEIHVPIKPTGFFEVFPYQLGADCSLRPYPIESLKSDYPIGSELRIVGKHTNLIPYEIQEGNIRLDVSPNNQFNLSVNLPAPTWLHSTKESIFDYTLDHYLINQTVIDSIANHYCDLLKIRTYDERMILSKSIWFLVDFEIRKDLYRLASTSNDTVKANIILRMKNYSQFGPNKIFNMINTYIQDSIIRIRLISKIFTIKKDSN